VVRVAGDKALILPSLLGNTNHIDFMNDWQKYLRKIEKDGKTKKDTEAEILEDFFKEQNDSHLLIHIIWATFGQNMEDVSNYITDILPSRLNKLSEINAKASKWQSSFFPKYPIQEANFNLHLTVLWQLFKRPGYGKKLRKQIKVNNFVNLDNNLQLTSIW
jgi:CRISPR-associated protein Csh1